MKRIATIVAASLLGFGVAQAQDDASSMSELLQQIQRGQARDSQEQQQRLQQFRQQQAEQQNLLNQARQQRTNLENESTRLETTFEENQQEIANARAQLDERLGDLRELFGVLQTVTGDAQGRFQNSLTNIHYPNRAEFLIAFFGVLWVKGFGPEDRELFKMRKRDIDEMRLPTPGEG